MNTIELPPKSISAHDFTSKVSGFYNEARFAAPNQRAIDRLRRLTDKIDPLHPIMLPAQAAYREMAQLGSSFVMGASVCSEALNQKTPTVKSRATTLKLLGDLLLSGADMLRHVPDQPVDELREGLVRAGDAYGEAMDLSKRNRYSHAQIPLLMGSLSARCMALHLDAREAHVSPHAGLRRLNKSAFAGIIQDTVGHMGNLRERITDKHEAGNERGLFMEMVCFGAKLLEWKDQGLEKGFARFALAREDRTVHSERPRRGYDVVLSRGTANTPYQVKTGSGSNGYDKRIIIWRPGRPDELMEQTDELVSWFRTVIDPRTDDFDRSMARTNLTSAFVEDAKTLASV